MGEAQTSSLVVYVSSPAHTTDFPKPDAPEIYFQVCILKSEDAYSWSYTCAFRVKTDRIGSLLDTLTAV